MTDNHLIVSDLREVVGDAHSLCGPTPTGPYKYACCKHPPATSCQWIAGTSNTCPDGWISCAPTPPPTPAPPTPPTPKPCSSWTQKATCESSSLITYSYTENLFSTASASGGPTPAPGPTPPKPDIKCSWDGTTCCDSDQLEGDKCPPIRAVWATPTHIDSPLPINAYCLTRDTSINTFINFGSGGLGQLEVALNILPADIHKMKNVWMNFGGSAAYDDWGILNPSIKYPGQASISSIIPQIKKLGYTGICIDWERGHNISSYLKEFSDNVHNAGLKLILVTSGLGPSVLSGEYNITGIDFDYIMLMMYRKNADSQGDPTGSGNYDNCIHCCTKTLCRGDNCLPGCSKSSNVDYYMNAWTNGNITVQTKQISRTILLDKIPRNKLIFCWAFGATTGVNGTAKDITTAGLNSTKNIAFWAYPGGDGAGLKGKSFPSISEMLTKFKWTAY